jgi:hypothetical protein
LLTKTGKGNEGFKPSDVNNAGALLPEYHDVGGMKNSIDWEGIL